MLAWEKKTKNKGGGVGQHFCVISVESKHISREAGGLGGSRGAGVTGDVVQSTRTFVISQTQTESGGKI